MLKYLIVTISVVLALAAAADHQEIVGNRTVIGDGGSCMNKIRDLELVSSTINQLVMHVGLKGLSRILARILNFVREVSCKQ